MAQPGRAAAAALFRMGDGRDHPAVVLGTYKVGFVPASASGQNGVASVLEHDVDAIVAAAVQCGVRAVDCAAYYGNEDWIGRAVANSGLPRGDMFLASKVWTDAVFGGPEHVRKQLEKTLVDLQTTYLDLYLIHWPVPGKHVAAYKALEELQREGKVRSIGVSNYTVEDVEELLAAGCSVPAVNQLEVNPFLFRPETLRYMKSKGILVEAYRGLYNGKALQHPLLVEIAARHARTVPQVMAKFLLQHGIVVVSKSSQPERVRSNVDLDGFELSCEELKQMEGLTRPEALESFADLYRKCAVRDTPLEAAVARGEDVGLRQTFTLA